VVSLGILVNTVAVGVIASGRAAERHRRQAPYMLFSVWAAHEAANRGVPLGLLGSSAEVAAAITFLASSAASYITGATLDVVGGLSHSW